MTGIKCYLRSLCHKHEPIPLENLKPVILGRSIQTLISDKRCSKNQLELTAFYEECKVQFKHLGSNHGGFRKNITKKGETYELHHNDVIEFLKGQYPYEIVFEPPPPSSTDSIKTENGNNIDSTSESKLNENKLQQNSVKRKCNALESFILKKSKMEWESLYDDALLVYNRYSTNSNKIASYDMDGTLITTASGRVFPKDANDWKIIYPEVPAKLKQLCEQGYKIVIFTNQAGVGRGKVSVKEIQTKIQRVIEKLGSPAQALVSTGKGKYRKPVPEMWNYFKEECNGKEEIDIANSFYVGDAAGRPEILKVRKKDHSIADRLFALNIGVTFYTPEEHFLGHKPSPFKMPDFIPYEIDTSCSLYSPCDTKVPNYPVEIILLVGFPGSGKSTYVEQNLLKLGYIAANRDSLGSWQKCATVMERALRDKKHVVIDNTNPDKASRERYIEVAKREKVPIRCFIFNVILNHAKHNNKFRALSGSDHSKVNDIIYNMYKAKYEEPTEKEGFSEIVKINFIPSFKNSDMEKLYKLFLLEN